MLEQAIAPPDEGNKIMQRIKSEADATVFQRTQVSDDTRIPSGRLPKQEEAIVPEKPHIPSWLATARAREALAALPSDIAVPQQFSAAPFSPFQHQAGTDMMPLHSPLVSHIGQYQPDVPEPTPQASSSPYGQQQTGQQPYSVTANSRQQLLPASSRPLWRPEARSSSLQSSPSTPANFAQPPLPVQPFHQYPHQHSVQPLQGQEPPSIPAWLQEQSSVVSPSSYEHSSPDRSVLEQQRMPPDAHHNGNSHLPQTYWPNQATASYGAPDTSTFPPPSATNLVYDRALGTAAARTMAPLPCPRSLATQLAAGYYVRAAGKLRIYPVDGRHALHEE